jgi:hypothetical protein
MKEMNFLNFKLGIGIFLIHLLSPFCAIVLKVSSGAVVSLIKAQTKLETYKDSIGKRNVAVRDYLYWNHTSHHAKLDIVLFHEGNINTAHQTYIQSLTPEMPLIFIDVGEIFGAYKNVNITICPKDAFVSSFFGPGYHSMCYFWFIGFQRYVSKYAWLLRIDDDCILTRDIRRYLKALPSYYAIASPLWLDLSIDKSDGIRRDFEGGVVRGLRSFTEQYAQQHGIYNHIDTWLAPYTNVMYLDLDWLRNQTQILGYMKAVEASQCIYSNRWGDLPLWGAVTHLSKLPHYHLKLPYYHGSHQLYVNETNQDPSSKTII